MKSTVHRMTEEITKALGPIFHKTPEYDVIFPAMCMCMARVIQSTPDVGQELDVLEDAHNEIKHALTQFLEIEREKEAKAKIVDSGINGFDQFAQPVIEPGSAGDHPDNPNQNVAKTVEPFDNQRQDEYTTGEGPYSEP